MIGAGEPLQAVALFGHTPHGADYLFNVSVPGGERHAVHLVWWAAERLRELGVEALNIGGGRAPGGRPGADRAGLKRRFGGVERPPVSLRQVYRPDAYERLCLAAGVSPERSGWF